VRQFYLAVFQGSFSGHFCRAVLLGSCAGQFCSCFERLFIGSFAGQLQFCEAVCWEFCRAVIAGQLLHGSYCISVIAW